MLTTYDDSFWLLCWKEKNVLGGYLKDFDVSHVKEVKVIHVFVAEHVQLNFSNGVGFVVY